MAEKIKISFAESAILDLEETLSFYEEKNIPHIGRRLVSNVIDDVELLKTQSDMGRIVPEFESEYIRELIRPPFRIVYRRDPNKVRIIRVWRSERFLKLPE